MPLSETLCLDQCLPVSRPCPSGLAALQAHPSYRPGDIPGGGLDAETLYHVEDLLVHDDTGKAGGGPRCGLPPMW